jgi:hypothetical protein
MPTYTFRLNDDNGGVEDDTGVSLVNTKAAYLYACDVARELMRCREQNTRGWHLDVYEDNRKVFEIPFAELDETFDRPRRGSPLKVTRDQSDKQSD